MRPDQLPAAVALNDEVAKLQAEHDALNGQPPSVSEMVFHHADNTKTAVKADTPQRVAELRALAKLWLAGKVTGKKAELAVLGVEDAPAPAPAVAPGAQPESFVFTPAGNGPGSAGGNGGGK